MYLLYLFVYINVSLIKFIIPPHSYSHVPRRGCICPHPPPEVGGNHRPMDLPRCEPFAVFGGNKWTWFRVGCFFSSCLYCKECLSVVFVGIGGSQLEPANATREENWKTLLSFNVIHFCLNDGNNFGL